VADADGAVVRGAVDGLIENLLEETEK